MSIEIAGELAKPWGKASRYCGTPACSKEPTGMDNGLAYGMEYSGISHYICQCTSRGGGMTGDLLGQVGWTGKISETGRYGDTRHMLDQKVL